MTGHKTDVTGPSEAEIEAAFAAIAALSKCTLPCRLQFACVCRDEARAAVTAAAQVREKTAVTHVVEIIAGGGGGRDSRLAHDPEDAQLRALISRLGQCRAGANYQLDFFERQILLRTFGLMPIYSATEDTVSTAGQANNNKGLSHKQGAESTAHTNTEPDQGEDVLGYRPPDGE